MALGESYNWRNTSDSNFGPSGLTFEHFMISLEGVNKAIKKTLFDIQTSLKVFKTSFIFIGGHLDKIEMDTCKTLIYL